MIPPEEQNPYLVLHCKIYSALGVNIFMTLPMTGLERHFVGSHVHTIIERKLIV
jgi:hypothetical protein